ncbi:restriction endonuclease subunit S [Aeromonas caviae]|uniref:restriction endonuclease subunit S n=1 Tax=Aeromonas TaxID=642 RepID=UPI001D0A0293|nr:restriction endonuclease subunit S [Aeromonas caviae]UDN25449.1 restriction endonuclease subunit S [Aeromonas caviae]
MVPKGWTHTTLGKVMVFKNGLNFTKADVGEEIKIVGVSDFKDLSELRSTERLESVNVASHIKDDELLTDGDLLFVRSNGNKDLIGRCLFFPEVKERLSFSGFTIRGRADKKNILPQYIAFVARSSFFKSQISQYGGGTNISNLSQQILNDIALPLPPHDEQKKIVQILSTWDKAIGTTEQLLANSQQQKKALMHQLLTGKKRLLDSNGVRFSGEWKKVKVRDLIIQYSEKTDRNNQYPVLTSSRQGMLFQKDYYNGRDVASEDTTGYNVVPFGYFTYRHMSDDLNFSFNINELCEKGIVSTLYPVFKAKEEEITPYLLRLILNEGREFKHFSLAQKQGGSRTYMYLSKLQELKLNIPRLEEQQRIAAVLSTAEQEINALQQKLDALKQEKRALMQQLLTGKLRVQVPKEEVAC